MRVGGGCVALTALLGVADYKTGVDVSFAFLYLVPVVLAAAVLGPRMSGAVSALAAGAWLAADAAARNGVYSSGLVPVWNGSTRFLIFCLVAGLVASLRRMAAHERAMSRLDLLSGLPNSRGFREKATVELARARRTGRPLSVAYIDIDDFKTVNDTLGHTEGDRVITHTGTVIARLLRNIDNAARLGGDEFAVLLPETDRSGAEAVMGRLHDTLEGMAREKGWPIGFSMGVVTFPATPPSVDAAIARVDALMYEAKRAGKHRVRYETEPWEPVTAARPGSHVALLAPRNTGTPRGGERKPHAATDLG